MSRIRQLPLEQGTNAKHILEWMTCSRVALSKQELVQALMIREGDTELDLDRKLLQDLRQLCGPIVEMRDNQVTFVHFTAKE
jgi:hypothetical protein